jgi:hypothetical protein
MTAIDKLRDDIKIIDNQIEFCKSIGDAPEDYKDLTDERAILVKCLAVAIAGGKL